MPARRPLPALATILLLAIVAVACGNGAGSADPTTAAGSVAPGSALPAAELSLVAFSTPQTAYEAIIKAFRATPRGRNITFTQSYGASGDQSRAVESGLAADVVAFSLETDITRLVKANLVATDWNQHSYRGIVTNSLVVFVVRRGNPLHIRTWNDLTKDGIEVITPNPFTSGAARWNILAAYGQARDVHHDRASGRRYLEALFDNVVVQDDSGRKALQTFTQGKGDVLLSYENEAIFAQHKDQPIDHVIPADTLLIENPVAVTSTSKHPKQARAFLDFLYSKTAQRIFADNGYTPVVEGVAKEGEFTVPARLFTIADLGGWATVTKRFFDPDTGVVTAIERDKGVPIEKK